MKPQIPFKGMGLSVLVVLSGILHVFAFPVPDNGLAIPATSGTFNNAPVAVDDHAHLVCNSTVTASFIQNDYDPDGDALSMNGMTINTAMPPVFIMSMSTLQGGVISFFTDGNFTYTPALNFFGDDQAGYRICDVTPTPLCATATIYLYVKQVGSVLPVMLSSFSGKKSGKDILLKWSTAQESNSNYFEIQHSTDNTRFIQLAQVKAKGNSNSSTEYNFVHDNPAAIINYYRIKMVDKDGTATYSKVIAIKPDGNSISLQTVYPDPFLDKLELAITTEQAGTITITMYDLSGKLVLQRTTKTIKGLNIITLTDLGNLKAGSYFINVKGTDNILQAKLHKVQ